MAKYNRTHNNGELRINNVNENVVLSGWVAKKRNLGGLIFIDLRDRYGITQIVCKPDNECYGTLENVKNEYVLQVFGKVIERESKNKNIPTGDIEVEVSDCKVLSEAMQTPMIIADNTDALEDLRMKYRYLDLRRPVMQKNLIMRHNITKAARRFLDSLDFVEIETPMFGKSTPEGARDYVVPSRVHPGKFYALPQSPQIYKQLLMVSGMEKYYQIARCFRDEDLRADRQMEFTQIDLEMSFVDEEDVYEVMEGMLKAIFKDVMNIDIQTPLPRLGFDESMERYGCDKPDLRFEMKLQDVSSLFENSSFDFLKGKVVKAIVVENAADKFTRKEIDGLAEVAKLFKAKGLCWAKVNNDNLEGASAKLIEDKEAFKNALGYKHNDLVLFVADEWLVAVNALGQVRNAVAKKLNLADPNVYKFLWVTEFPMYEYNEEGKLSAMHHPFTAYIEEDEKYIENEPLKVRSNAYDLVLNGYELGSGSVRIYNQEMQKKVFERIGLSDFDITNRFGFFVEALKYGTPPHMGMAFGLERIVMILTGTSNIRDVVAFPKIQSAADLMNECPSPVDEEALNMLGIKVK